MSWLKFIAGILLILQSLAADYTIYWSDSNIFGQVYHVLYGSAVEFRCHNKTVNNLYEVSKEEYDSCELQQYHRSLLNCTRDIQRGRDITTILFVQHPVPNPYLKDYLRGQSYYFISTASDRGSDKERISNVAGGNCKKNSMKITVKVVSKITEDDGLDPSSEEKKIPDPGGQDSSSGEEIPRGESTNTTYNTTEDQVSSSASSNGASSSAASGVVTRAPRHHSARVLAILLLTLMYLLYS